MGLKTMSLVTSPTAITITGGTPLVFADDGVTIQNGVHLVVPADSDYALRRSCTAKYKPPTLDPKLGTYSKDKKSVSFAIPLQLPGGKMVFNVIRIEREVHPFMMAEDALQLKVIGAQLLADSQMDAFWAAGSMN